MITARQWSSGILCFCMYLVYCNTCGCKCHALSWRHFAEDVPAYASCIHYRHAHTCDFSYRECPPHHVDVSCFAEQPCGGNQGKQLPEAVQAALDTSLVQARQALRALSEAAQAVRNAVAGADEGLDSLSKTEAWVRLAESRDLIDTLSAINGKLKRVVDAFNGSLEDGTNVGAWKLMKKTNWNVLGATAREKRAKREKEAGKTAEE